MTRARLVGARGALRGGGCGGGRLPGCAGPAIHVTCLPASSASAENRVYTQNAQQLAVWSMIRWMPQRRALFVGLLGSNTSTMPRSSMLLRTR